MLSSQNIGVSDKIHCKQWENTHCSCMQALLFYNHIILKLHQNCVFEFQHDLNAVEWSNFAVGSGNTCVI